MREIKFRAWHGQHDVPQMVGFAVPPSFPFPTMQYTGLKDKNGKEIYEGDVVLYQLDAPWNEDEILELRASVKYEGAGFVTDGITQNSYDAPLDQVGDLEVIGNIYENPELLENMNGD